MKGVATEPPGSCDLVMKQRGRCTSGLHARRRRRENTAQKRHAISKTPSMPFASSEVMTRRQIQRAQFSLILFIFLLESWRRVPESQRKMELECKGDERATMCRLVNPRRGNQSESPMTSWGLCNTGENGLIASHLVSQLHSIRVYVRRLGALLKWQLLRTNDVATVPLTRERRGWFESRGQTFGKRLNFKTLILIPDATQD